jgi:hypothetical protein
VGSPDLTLKASLAVSTGLISESECPASEYIIFGNGVVAPDGTIYMGYRLCPRLALAISRDEGKTWQTSLVPGANLPSFESIATYLVKQNVIPSEPLALDSDGNLYAIWNDDQEILKYAVSTDHGTSWTAPITISAPGVVATALSSIAVSRPGTIAISYLGSTDHLQYNGYMAESTNALDEAPIFSSLIVNDPTQPLFQNGYDNNYSGVLTGGDLDEFIQIKYAPNGDIWSSFIKEMCVNLDAAMCSWDVDEHAGSMLQGATGRLVHRP